jgi:hypothetical protein
MAPVQPADLYYIKYTDDFQSFIDVSLIALIIYITTEIYYNLFQPHGEVNLSVVWCGMIVGYGFLTLSSITLNYLRTSEASLLLVFAGLSFMLSLLVQLADTKFFDFNLKDAFRNFSNSTVTLIQQHLESQMLQTDDASSDAQKSQTQQQQQNYPRPTTSQKIYSHIKTYSTNELMFTCTLAAVSGFIGALLFFPSFRLARLHYLCLKYSDNSKFKRFVYYLSFMLPLLISLCWVKTSVFTRQPRRSANGTLLDEVNSTNAADTVQAFLDYITKSDQTEDNWDNSNNQTVISYAKEVQKTLVTGLTFVLKADNLHVYLILFAVALRIVLYNYYAQSYLNLGFELASSLRQRATRITNLQYINTLSSIYQYYGVVASQYVIPLVILLFMSFLLKTLGNYSWCGQAVWCQDVTAYVSSAVAPNRTAEGGTSSGHLFKQLETAGFNFTLGHSALSTIFTPFVLRSLIGYFTFWICTIWFTISCFGLLYYQYIDRSIVLESA